MHKVMKPTSLFFFELNQKTMLYLLAISYDFNDKTELIYGCVY